MPSRAPHGSMQREPISQGEGSSSLETMQRLDDMRDRVLTSQIIRHTRKHRRLSAGSGMGVGDGRPCSGRAQQKHKKR
jgi:hypothetical protein